MVCIGTSESSKLGLASRGNVTCGTSCGSERQDAGEHATAADVAGLSRQGIEVKGRMTLHLHRLLCVSIRVIWLAAARSVPR